jgi:hypothetical protein
VPLRGRKAVGNITVVMELWYNTGEGEEASGKSRKAGVAE